ncbi:MFS transporter [Pediococcus siamensis]|uniref:MFS transporter n=1 Tax=Pediococcus siamensis TaxID=381829 RepID=UPI0039A11289
MNRIHTKVNSEIVKYFISVSFSSAANSASALAIYWYVLQTTEKVSILVLTGVLQSLPAMFAVFISTFANKKGSKFLMTVSDFIRTMLFILITITCNSSIGVSVAVLVNILLQVFEQLRTAATTTIIPDIVQNSKISSWVGISNSVTAAFELIGITIGGFLFDKFNYLILFLIISVLFAFSSLFSSMLQSRASINEDNGDLNFSFIDTIKHIARSKVLIGIIILAVIVNISFAPLDIMLTTFVHSVLKEGAMIYGFMDGGLTGGMILGSLLFGIVASKWRIKPIVVFGFLGCSVILFGLSFTSNWLISIIEVSGLGVLMAFVDSSMDAWLLEMVPENGRIAMFTTVTSLFTVAAPIGTGLLGFILSKTNISLVLLLMSLMILVGVSVATKLREEE